MKDNKILLVTGASSDVGSLLIDNVAHNYYRVIAHYRSNKNTVERLREKYGNIIIPIQSDFSDLESIQEMINMIKIQKLCPDHIVHLSSPKVNNLQFHKNKWDEFEYEMNSSLRPIVMMCQQFIPFMSKQKSGKIIFMLTAYLIGQPPKFLSPYITTKYSLLGLMKSLNSEYASKGISINAISPEMIETKFLSELPELIKEQSAGNSPIKRNLEVGEVVPTIEYLLSERADRICGQNIGITSGIR